ncbi:uncharacterized protein LOC128210522 [Mya arenaria]|uniref:uncharacterized protein LOC128210522 n=1 Tax=Mya arenaria TaxID=6604 RepID=UPI0022DF61C6|nr:uncharacterized protein LOC128210522 [Mya arenaria]
MRVSHTVLVGLILSCYGASGEDARTDSSKRLVLHSAEDQAAEIVNLKQTIASLQTTIASLQNTTISMQTAYQTLQTTTSSLQTDYNTLQTRTSSLQTDYQTLQNAYKSLDSQVQTFAVNTGYISGKRYNEAGSGVDTFCLPDEPVWGRYSDATDTFRGYIYGSEIDHNDGDHVFPYPVNEQDMPCVVCRSERALNLMIPGRISCYPGWTLEYSGYMMTASQSSGSSQDTICVDDHPEFLDHGGTNDNQHILYLVVAKCGSLPCPPYVNNRELPCAVCSK